MADVHEFFSFRFLPELDEDAQFETMAELHPLVVGLDGLKLREYFYSRRDESWVTHLVWRDEAAIDAAAPVAEANSESMALVARMDSDSMRYARFELVASSGAAAPPG